MRPLAFLVVTGGGILEQTMAALRTLPARDSVDWRRVSVWWGDERFVAADSADRNDRAAYAALLDALPLDPANVHRMPAAGAEFGDDAEAAADAYATELAAAVLEQHDGDVPHFDAVLLGIGPDGHCASLFPEHPGVYEEDAAVIAVRNSPKSPPTRISLTFRGLEAANEMVRRCGRVEGARRSARARRRGPRAGARGRTARAASHAVAARPRGGREAAGQSLPAAGVLTGGRALSSTAAASARRCDRTWLRTWWSRRR